MPESQARRLEREKEEREAALRKSASGGGQARKDQEEALKEREHKEAIAQADEQARQLIEHMRATGQKEADVADTGDLDESEKLAQGMLEVSRDDVEKAKGRYDRWKGLSDPASIGKAWAALFLWKYLEMKSMGINPTPGKLFSMALGFQLFNASENDTSTKIIEDMVGLLTSPVTLGAGLLKTLGAGVMDAFNGSPERHVQNPIKEVELTHDTNLEKVQFKGLEGEENAKNRLLVDLCLKESHPDYLICKDGVVRKMTFDAQGQREVDPTTGEPKVQDLSKSEVARFKVREVMSEINESLKDHLHVEDAQPSAPNAGP